MEELCSFASGDKLLQVSTKTCTFSLCQDTILAQTRPASSLTLSGRDCWFLCGQYRGRIRQQPWRRPPSQSSTSSACPSVEEVVESQKAKQEPKWKVTRYEKRGLQAAGWTWSVQRWSRVSSCGRWCRGNPSERCTSIESGSLGRKQEQGEVFQPWWTNTLNDFAEWLLPQPELWTFPPPRARRSSGCRTWSVQTLTEGSRWSGTRAAPPFWGQGCWLSVNK